ncbi:hypothetical protein FJQ87_05010 [Shewanella sp. SNU WT4]|uniref:hypothetical protein n=1 Tax=Shewanella sp. SNU WT4 TaxID=2590015 RepID=UPI001126854B|nr:hypothetical protein [Shewanella sp. SNU WT4]QDF66127.1 hypothetical protein FJQ87_05010 [Shewanella sp. SNU WT4]
MKYAIMRSLALLLMMSSSQSVLASTSSGWIKVSEPLLYGIWGNSNDGGATFSRFDEYLKDGTFRVWGSLPEGGDYEAEGVYVNLYDNGQKKSCARYTKVSEEISHLVDHSFCVIIMSINERQFSFKDSDSGKVSVTYRMPQ